MVGGVGVVVDFEDFDDVVVGCELEWDVDFYDVVEVGLG